MKYEDQLALSIISKAGDAKSKLFEALEVLNEENDKEKFDDLIKDSESLLNEAHKMQFELLASESNNKEHEISYLLVHAQDHLMTTLSLVEITTSLIDYIHKLKGELNP